MNHAGTGTATQQTLTGGVTPNGTWLIYLVIACVALVVAIVLTVVAVRRGRLVVDATGARGGVGLAAGAGTAALVGLAVLSLSLVVIHDNSARTAISNRAAHTLPRPGTQIAAASQKAEPPTKLPAKLHDLGLRAMTGSEYTSIADKTASQMQSESVSTMRSVAGSVYTKDGSTPYALVEVGRLTTSLPAKSFTQGVLSGAKTTHNTAESSGKNSLTCGDGGSGNSGEVICAWSDGDSFVIIDYLTSLPLATAGKETNSIQTDVYSAPSG
jgi:hypothetical protein